MTASEVIALVRRLRDASWLAGQASGDGAEDEAGLTKKADAAEADLIAAIEAVRSSTDA